MTELNIINTSENSFIGRKEITFKLPYESSTPKTEEVKALVAAHFKVKPELIKIVEIMPVFGDRYANVKVNIYHDEAIFKKFEIINKKKKEKKESAPKQEQKK